MEIINLGTGPDEARGLALDMLTEGGRTFPQVLKALRDIERKIDQGQAFDGTGFGVKVTGKLMMLVVRGMNKK